jgi:hypothetical protein
MNLLQRVRHNAELERSMGLRLSEVRQLLALLTAAQELKNRIEGHLESLPTAYTFEECAACQVMYRDFKAALAAIMEAKND